MKFLQGGQIGWTLFCLVAGIRQGQWNGPAYEAAQDILLDYRASTEVESDYEKAMSLHLHWLQVQAEQPWHADVGPFYRVAYNNALLAFGKYGELVYG